jgi:hypothetical protein
MNPEVLKRKAANVVQEGDADGPKKKIANVWGVPNFLPEDSQEDQASIQKHKAFLKKQSKMKDVKRDQDRIKGRMDKTFADRRQLIVTERKLVQDVKEEYPLLFNEIGVGIIKELHVVRCQFCCICIL